MDAVTLYSTWPDMDRAGACARVLVAERLAACANILPTIRSIYRWDDAIQDEAEVAMLVKTRGDRAAAVRDRILTLHPYDTPCIVVWQIAAQASAPAFLDWIARETV